MKISINGCGIVPNPMYGFKKAGWGGGIEKEAEILTLPWRQDPPLTCSELNDSAVRAVSGTALGWGQARRR